MIDIRDILQKNKPVILFYLYIYIYIYIYINI